ncbi:MAG TPA: glycosyltransferase family 1 protein [Mangrovimonas sp.]|nr:glycosyltransferase family 1 protein [Mangrovimonas sp.]
MIRVLQVLTIMNRGGAETMIMNYYRAIDRSKVQFDFLLHRQEKGAYDDEIEALGGKIYRLFPISPKNYKAYKTAVHDFLLEHKEYRIIHSHLNALSFIILKEATQLGVPVRIAHSHIAVESSVLKKVFKKNTDILGTVKDFIQHRLRKKVAKYATHYFACGEKAGLWLYGQANLSKVFVMNNAIDSSVFTYDKSISDATKASLGLVNKKVIGHVGRFNEQKNHFFLIDIMKHLVAIDDSYRLLLIGEGNLKEKIKAKVNQYNLQEHVVFMGVRTDINVLLQAIDLFVFPSLYEGLPVTLVEAQASGTRILASDTISTEVAITNLVHFESLLTTPKDWALKANQLIDYTKPNTHQEIISGGYDIYQNAKDIQSFYLKQ